VIVLQTWLVFTQQFVRVEDILEDLYVDRSASIMRNADQLSGEGTSSCHKAALTVQQNGEREG
jgi:hypothetical protein